MSDPTVVDLGDSWKPASLREAEAQLDETMKKSRELIKQVEEKLAQLPDVDHTAKPEDVTRIKAAAERPDAPAALRALKKKVDAGELTWQDVLEGKALKDETVREALSSRLDDMREIYQEAEAGATLDEILEARGVTSGSVFGGGSSSTYAQAAPSAPPSEDDYFSSSHALQSGPAPSQTPPPAPAPAEPAAAQPPDAPPAQQPRRTPPPARRREEYSEDVFENPLASRDESRDDSRDEQRGDSRDEPKRSQPPRTSSRRRDEPDDDDDYFGGSVFR